MSELVARIVAGDSAAEEELIRSFSRGLRFLIQRRVRNPEDARDISQDTLVVVIVKIRAGELKNPDCLQAFIYGVAHNIIAGHFSRENRRRDNALEPLREEASTEPSPFELLQSSQIAKYVNQIIAELRMERDRALLTRYFVDEIDKTDLCKELSVSSAHFDMLKNRAINRLISMVRANGVYGHDD
jgi:RNA polymerase sigma factor (sigma-70 family)